MTEVEVRLPQWGMGMLEGTVVHWHKDVGDLVAEGEPLADIESAKADQELVAPASGILAAVLVTAGLCVPVNELLAIIDTDPEVPAVPVHTSPEEIPPPAVASTGEKREATTVRTVPLVRRRASELGVEVEAVTGTGPNGRILVADVEAAAARPAAPSAGFVRNVVPRARAKAKAGGIDLHGVVGTGPGGRILVADVEALITGPHAASELEEELRPADGSPLSPMRRTIGRRMVESLQTTAQLTLFRAVDVTAVDAVRRSTDPSVRPSFVDIFIRVCAVALREHPDLNAFIDGDRLMHRPTVDIGFAVAVPGGLLVPVVRGADTRTLPEISEETRRLARQCREGRPVGGGPAGSGFTISSLGGQGIDFFTPILNPPEAAILGLGRAVERPVRYGAGIRWRTEMTLGLTIDHRIVDGAPGAEFLATVARLLEGTDQVFGGAL